MLAEVVFLLNLTECTYHDVGWGTPYVEKSSCNLSVVQTQEESKQQINDPWLAFFYQMPRSITQSQRTRHRE